VTLDGFETVYDFYERHEQSRAFARFGHLVLSRVYRTSVTTDEGVEDAISDALRAGTRLVISPNHTTADDQYVIVATAEKVKALHPLRGRAFIPAEPSLFTRPGWQGRLLRSAVDGLGAVPTFRLEDLRRRGIEITAEVEERYRQAIVRASETQVAKLVAGHSMAGFWEGTRNRTDYRVIQPLRKGIAHTVIAAAEHVPVALLPAGFYYGREPEDYQRPVLPGRHAPLVHLGLPIPVETTDPEELVGHLHPAIQRCVDQVVDRAGGQPSGGPVEADG
jgi:1-acyl-sn-glycerol-3-phosphate acyltransferase